jgi:CheY-like chemotaxis protein
VATQTITYLNDCLTNGNKLSGLILLNLSLPNRQEGWQLLQQLKHPKSDFRQLPIVLFLAIPVLVRI